MKILVADDYKKSRDQLEKMLAKKGYEVLIAKDGVEALTIYQENDIKVAFIDWSMPKLNGVDLCHRIRDFNLKTSHISYLILTSGKTKKRNMVEGLDAGVDDFILKPYSEDIVLSRVNVAKRVLETKVNKIPCVHDLKDKEIEPVAVLNEEHVLIHKITGVLEMVSNMLGEGMPLPKKLLKWTTSSVFMLTWDLHESKEYVYIDVFVERAKNIHGKTTQLYSRSSLTQIMREHEIIKELLLDMQKATKKYDIDNRKSVIKLRNIIARFLPLIRFHAAREEDVFLPFTQRYLTEDDISLLMEEFQKVEDSIGTEKIQSRLDTIEQLEKILKIKEKKV
ncbi:MAG: response regulator [Thermoplasmata archaeon]|nr:response regulator [Thermoplasmata archaeon]